MNPVLTLRKKASIAQLHIDRKARTLLLCALTIEINTNTFKGVPLFTAFQSSGQSSAGKDRAVVLCGGRQT